MDLAEEKVDEQEFSDNLFKSQIDWNDPQAQANTTTDRSKFFNTGEWIDEIPVPDDTIKKVRKANLANF